MLSVSVDQIGWLAFDGLIVFLAVVMVVVWWLWR
jgi:hypothetical protein